MRTDENLKALTDELQRNCGDLHTACRAVGLSPSFVMSWCRDDAVAAKEVDEAQRVGWLGLESEAIRRATGYEVDVWAKGQIVGTKTEYSDGLLQTVLKARVPAYSPDENSRNIFNGPTQINIMPRANNFTEWLEMKDKTLARRVDQDALPAPVDTPEILQGVFVEVSDAAIAAAHLMRSPLEGLGI